MKYDITICAEGLGHPEGPCQLDDGRIVFANTFASELAVWDPRTGTTSTYAKVGGGPNACVVGVDGSIYSTQTPSVGAWKAEIERPPSIQKTDIRGGVELLVTKADGVPFDGPNDLVFAPDGTLWFTDSGDWDPGAKPHPGRIIRVDKDGKASIAEQLDYAYPNGIVAQPDGSIIWVESYTSKVVRRSPDGAKHVLYTMRDGHIPDGLKLDADGNFWIATVAGGGVEVISKDGEFIDFLETRGTILNCCFGGQGALYVCDMGPFDVSGAAMTGRLLKIDVGVQGMRPFRGVIGSGATR